MPHGRISQTHHLSSLCFISVNAPPPPPPPLPTIKYEPGAESGSSVAFSLGDAQPNPLPCPPSRAPNPPPPREAPAAGRAPTVRGLRPPTSYRYCEGRSGLGHGSHGEQLTVREYSRIPSGTPYAQQPGGPGLPTLTRQECSGSLPSGKNSKPTSLLLFWGGMCPIPLSPYDRANALKGQGAQGNRMGLPPQPRGSPSPAAGGPWALCAPS